MNSETLEVSPELRTSMAFLTSWILSSTSVILQQLPHVIYRFLRKQYDIENEKTTVENYRFNLVVRNELEQNVLITYCVCNVVSFGGTFSICAYLELQGVDGF